MPRHKLIEVDPLDEKVVEEEDDVASQLAKLGAELSLVATDKNKRTAKLREVEAFLGRLKIDDFPELAESPTIQNFVKLLAPSDLRPGEVRNPGTLAEVRREWSREEFRKTEQMTFVPRETVKLIVNGVEFSVVDNGEEQTIPRAHYDVYLGRQRALRNAAQNERWALGLTDVPPDPSWITNSAIKIRALGKGAIGYGPIVLENPVEDTPEGENG